MAEVELEGHSYRTGRLNTIQQWEIFRRLGPVIPALSAEFREGVEATPGARWLMAGVTGSLGALPQADSDYVLQACLAVVDRRDPNTGHWFRVGANGRIMYEDIDLLSLLQLMDLVVQENLQNFFAKLRSASVAAEEQTTAMVAVADGPLGGLH